MVPVTPTSDDDVEAVQSDSQPFHHQVEVPTPHQLLGFNHPDDLHFWKRVYPESEEAPGEQDVKTFANIASLIEREFPEAPKLSKNLKFLKRCLLKNLNDEDEPVKMRNFIRLTKWFGPFTKSGNSCVFLEQMHKLSSYVLMQGNSKVSPFAGKFTQDQAEECLLKQDVKDESYLVRFSEGLADQGGFSLAVKANAAEIRHYNILKDPQMASQNQPPYNARLKLVHRTYQHLNEEEGEYRDIVDFMRNRLNDEIEDNIQCTYICPNLPYNALFKGYD